MSDPVADLKALTTEQPANPLRPAQVGAYEQELRRLGALRDSKDMDGKAAPWIGAPTADTAKRIRAIHQTLEQQAPKRITGERANRVYAKVEEVLEQAIKPAMLSRAVMRRNPAGAVGHFLRGENSPAVKDAILTVKRAIRALDPDNPDPDLTNMERFRPEGTGVNGTATFMPDATIPGFLSMSPQAKANWPLGEPTADTALKQVQRAATRTAPRPPRAKWPASPAQLAALERAHTARRAKRAAAAQGSEPPPAAKE